MFLDFSSKERIIVSMKSQNVGDIVVVKASEFLGTPACTGTIVEFTDQGYLVKCDDDHELVDVSFNMYPLIGPPLWVGARRAVERRARMQGKLVEAR